MIRALRIIRNRVSTLGIGGRVSFLQQPLFRVYLCLDKAGTGLRPSLASVQHAINDVARRIVLLPRSIRRWKPAVSPAQLAELGANHTEQQRVATFFDTMAKSKELLIVVLQLSGTLVGVEARVGTFVERFAQ